MATYGASKGVTVNPLIISQGRNEEVCSVYDERHDLLEAMPLTDSGLWIAYGEVFSILIATRWFEARARPHMGPRQAKQGWGFRFV